MGGLKYYERTKLLIELIEKEKKGSPTEIAGRLGVTKRTVYNIIGKLRLTLPRIISYNTEKKSTLFVKIIDSVKVFFSELDLSLDIINQISSFKQQQQHEGIKY